MSINSPSSLASKPFFTDAILASNAATSSLNFEGLRIVGLTTSSRSCKSWILAYTKKAYLWKGCAARTGGEVRRDGHHDLVWSIAWTPYRMDKFVDIYGVYSNLTWFFSEFSFQILDTIKKFLGIPKLFFFLFYCFNGF